MDTVTQVLQNYKTWLGGPEFIVQPETKYPELSLHFSILGYSKSAHKVLCTAGGSYNLVPNSKGRFSEGRGVAYEYILHSSSQNTDSARDILLRVCSYPYLTNRLLYAGDLIPVGEDIFDIHQLNHIYLTFPYEEDESIYTTSPKGQIILQDRVILTLWAIPIFEEEANLLQTIGPDKFDSLLGDSNFQAHILTRSSLAKRG